MARAQNGDSRATRTMTGLLHSAHMGTRECIDVRRNVFLAATATACGADATTVGRSTGSSSTIIGGADSLAEAHVVASILRVGGRRLGRTTVEDGFGKLCRMGNELHGTPLDAELHRHHLRNDRDAWTALRGMQCEAGLAYKAALEVARDAGVRYIFRGMDRARQSALNVCFVM